MTTKRILQSILLIAVLAGGLALPITAARAMSGTCGGYVTIEAGDTLQSIAATCGTTVDAILAANPGANTQPSPGQMLLVPGATSTASATPTPTSTLQAGSTYIVQQGDTLGGIAFMAGITLSQLLAVNPQIANPSLIYAGQVINLPGSSGATATPSPSALSQYGRLVVTYGHGLRVRTGPGTNFPEILSPFVSAVKFSNWAYRKASLTTDATGFVWVQIVLNPASGYSTGWILTRDSLGDYFTRPNLGPKIMPNDP